jgi:hypothetical protein
MVLSSSSFIMFTVSLLMLVACLALPSSAMAARSARSVRSASSPSAADDEAGHSRSVMTPGGDATVEQPPSSSSSSSEQQQLQRRSSSESQGFASLRECASACFNCVDLFGKDVYDGRKCIHGCGFTRGRTVDYDCSNTAMHILARAR